ncbi:hypothetical protein EJB05_28798, partial [Eragrostis curvula]
MKRRRLIRHWISSGLIKDRENKTLEEVAEGYLNELVNRSLLQVVNKNEFGRVKSCRMHDVIRHVALDKAEKDCFGHVDIDLLRPIIASSSLLSTLDLQGTQIKMLPIEVFSLFNLRFLGIRETPIEILPEGIGRLQNLEVLDAFGTALVSLPKGVSKLKKLRCLYACTLLAEGTLKLYRGIKVPRGIGNLTGLHALQDVKASLDTLCDVAALTELRTFAVSDVKSEHSANLCHAIVNMSHLVHLSISASNENEAYDGKKLYFSAQSFPRLRRLIVGEALQLNQVEIAEGALESLAVLWFPYCPQLKSLPDGIEYLTSLEELLFQDTAEELIENLRQEHDRNHCNKESTKISHIRKKYRDAAYFHCKMPTGLTLGQTAAENRFDTKGAVSGEVFCSRQQRLASGERLVSHCLGAVVLLVQVSVLFSLVSWSGLASFTIEGISQACN